jgi:hypothetical protein
MHECAIPLMQIQRTLKNAPSWCVGPLAQSPVLKELSTNALASVRSSRLFSALFGYLTIFGSRP